MHNGILLVFGFAQDLHKSELFKVINEIVSLPIKINYENSHS